MKSCVVRKRFFALAGFNESGVATTVDLEPGFGIPKACIIYYTSGNPSTGDNTFDISTAFRTAGVGFIGSTDSNITSNLAYRSVYVTQIDGVAASGSTIVRRQNNTNRYLYSQDTAGAVFWQGTTATFSTDQATFLTAGSTPNTNDHIDSVIVFLGGNDLQVAVGNTQFPSTANTSLSYSALSFTPECVLVASSISTAGQGLTDDARFSFGCGLRTLNTQKSIYWHNETPTTNVSLIAMSSSSFITYYTTGAAVGPYTFSINTITSGGWTMTAGASVPTSNVAYNFLALATNNPNDFSLLDFKTYVSTGASFIGTGTSGFVPYTITGGLTNVTSDNTRVANTAIQTDGFTLCAGYRSPHSVLYNGNGTLSVTSGNTAVSGTNSEFARLNPGANIYNTSGALAGTISNITSKTALTLAATSNITITSSSYLYSTPGQYYVAFGNSFNAATTNVYSGIGSTLFVNTRMFGAGVTVIEQSTMQRDDTRPGLVTNTQISGGTSRLGWILAFRDDSYSRRRGGIS